jgi:uncharacterized protein YhbP (UPF0306 family)
MFNKFMNEQILNFIKSKRVGVLAVQMPDGSPHAATIHFAYEEEPLVFLFETSPETKKASVFKIKQETEASFVIGTDAADTKTLQMNGIAKAVTLVEKENFEEKYFGRFPEKKGKHANQFSFIFTPTWWRFTDWNTPEGKKILSSDSHE